MDFWRALIYNFIQKNNLKKLLFWMYQTSRRGRKIVNIMHYMWLKWDLHEVFVLVKFCLWKPYKSMGGHWSEIDKIQWNVRVLQ